MNTHFQLLNRSLKLLRYPEQGHNPSLQAWDATDELLIDYVTQQIPDYPNLKIRIYNDDFGALGCWFAEQNPTWVSDSFVATQGCKQNLERNQLTISDERFFTSTQSVDQPADIVLLKIPKTTALLEQQLIDLQAYVSSNTRVIAGGKVKLIQKSTQALFSQYLGACHTSLAKKKSRLIFCQPTGDKRHTSPYPTVWKTTKPDFTISNLANVFARQQLDIGARFMLSHLARIPLVENQRVIDLGCGNGVLGLHVLHNYPSANVIFIDESFMAVKSAEHNVKQNIPSAHEHCEFIVNNCLDEFASKSRHASVDLILCNPPFHQQNTITDHIAWQMFKDAKQVLRPQGKLIVVGNRHLDYPQKLKRLFTSVSTLASDKKFSILSASK
jgi:16S rRNA (guanine1207-N2)-methyltransferase/23S rRNA (guanine1835-N2)-methyltransferase